jgi:integrase
VRAFQVHLVAGGKSWPALNQTVCALRFFYGVTPRRAELPERIAYSRELQKLPVVLSADEVVRFLEVGPSLKSRAALTTAYAAGLRASEASHLKVANIDNSRMVIRIEQGKGGRERYVMLSPQLLDILRGYWRIARPRHWLFPRADAGTPDPPHPSERGLPHGLRRRRTRQTRHRSHAAPWLRHAFARERHGHPDHPGAARTSQRQHHGAIRAGRDEHDPWHTQPAGPREPGGNATLLSRSDAPRAGGGGRFPPLWRRVSRPSWRASRPGRAARHGGD